MEAIKQKCRPKHQVLVLKCYPRTTKGAVDVKPNSSELSYLLFYATSRRSKIQKIGAFLEKKTAGDVWRLRIGNVQVTLGILAALVEKSPKDAALISPYLLKILDQIVRSNDITLVESSLPTFSAFCENHDPSSLFADQSYSCQYESVIRAYAHLASTRGAPSKGNATTSLPMQLRWRHAGLDAINSIASSDSLSSVTGRQIDVIVPMILENLWTDSDEFIDMLMDRVHLEEKVKSESLLRRRTSVATVQTADTPGDTNPVALSGTARDVDKLAEEDIGVLAMQCLSRVFTAPNGSQIFAATGALLKFTLDRVSQGETVMVAGQDRRHDTGWAIKMFGMIARCAPVQDRYVILVKAMDTLSRTPMKEGNMYQHKVIIAMIGSLLRSDTNLIGLSIMDVLQGLVKQMRKLFLLSSDGSRSGSGSGNDETADNEKPRDLSPRDDLLWRLERCIGDLASHVYYADQITDMIAAVVARLRPRHSSSTTSTPQAEKIDAGESNGPNTSLPNLTESQSPAESYFSYNQGKLSGLRVIKGILLVANPKGKVALNMNLSRNRVPMQVWEGTHWILRDPDWQVRKAYVDALCTWLDRETTPADLKANDEALIPQHSSLKNSRELPAEGIAKRAVSNASTWDRPSRGRRSQFLALLHLAMYDNALQFVENETDLVLLHALLAKLTFKLGVNATRYGIPMIFRLQEEIQEVDVPVHKVRIAALCHGYLWILTEKFDIEASVVGRAIHNEIYRRRNKGFWVEGIAVPVQSISSIGLPGSAQEPPSWDISELEQEELLPFDDRTSLVQCIATSYEESVQAPPTSPAASPGKNLSTPVLGSTLSAEPVSTVEEELPSNFRVQMLADWSRESVMTALAAAAKTESLSGSKRGTLDADRQRLHVQTTGLNGNTNGNGNGNLPASPYGSIHNLRPYSASIAADRDRLGTLPSLRKTSLRSAVSATPSAKGGVASVEQLKMVLSGAISPEDLGLTTVDDDSADSMISYDYTASEVSFSPPTQPETDANSPSGPKRTVLATGRVPPSLHSPDDDTRPDDKEDDDGVPPVPPLPTSYSMSGKSDISVQDHALRLSRRNLHSRGGESLRVMSIRSRDDNDDDIHGVDLQDILRGIDSRPSEGSLGGVTRPPY